MTREFWLLREDAIHSFLLKNPIQWRQINTHSVWFDWGPSLENEAPDFENRELEWRVKPEPRRVWAHVVTNGHIADWSDTPHEKWVEFVEVVK